MFKKFFDLFLSPQTSLHSLFTIWQKGEKVGSDYIGNTYYRGEPRKGYKKERRWVKFANEAEATQVPPEFHGWLHHQTNIFPSAEAPSFRKSWQKPHVPNLTGTQLAYRPPGHVLNNKQRAKARGDYEAWRPDQ